MSVVIILRILVKLEIQAIIFGYCYLFYKCINYIFIIQKYPNIHGITEHKSRRKTLRKYK